MEEKISALQKDYLEKIKQADSLKELDTIFLELFGKAGAITVLPKEFPNLSEDDRRKVGPLFNSVKQELEKAIEEKRNEVREESYEKLEKEEFSLTPLRCKARTGHLHPVTQLENEIIELFGNLGFKQYSAPHIDSEQYNFELLNIPQGHPARDLWDTLYIDTKNLKSINPGELLLRTHTSNAQVRIMEEFKPPIRMMIIDRCFRYENVDARHEHTLDQFEIVYIDKGVSMANLQYLSEYFFKGILGQDIKILSFC
ncbi:hypothetical protein HYS95_03735 [Candidatus Daviesbacteria bacterium]|nr:hypothetical protein [Candidatus Daviesbacteria bacterium]